MRVPIDWLPNEGRVGFLMKSQLVRPFEQNVSRLTIAFGPLVCDEHQCAFHLLPNTESNPRVLRRTRHAKPEIAIFGSGKGEGDIGAADGIAVARVEESGGVSQSGFGLVQAGRRGAGR